MQFNSTMELLESDPESKKYFDSQSADVQKRILDRYTNARSLAELRVFCDVLARNEFGK